jgi:F-type H+-transporting ATPase subunit epsilon
MSSQEGGPARLRVEVITPEGPAYADEARMVIVPGAEGELGVLARHAPLVARLEPGETRVMQGENDWVSFATGPGYFKVQHDVALVLVSSAQKAAEIDTGRAQEDLEAAQQRLEKAREDDDQRAARRAARDVADAENRLEVAHSR